MPRIRLRLSFLTRLMTFLLAGLLTTGVFLTFMDIDASSKDFDLNFIPANLEGCEQLFANTSAARFSMSLNYLLRQKAFDVAVQKATYGLPIEGFSRQMREQYLVLHYLARQLVARSVCETGFNMGHSSFNYLTANNRIVVNSFDLGLHPYAYVMSEYLRNLFPSRFFVHFGNSTQTIPNFIRANPGFRCDLMFVDGGHLYPVALADLRNLASIANLEGNVIVLDDFPTDWGSELGMAWDEMTRDGIIKELMRCRFTYSMGVRGFVIGRVVKRPSEMVLNGNEERS